MHVLQTRCRSEEARQAERQQRFSDGYKYDQVLPHTKGLRALALAAMCPALRRLSIDERASCVGGMTNDLARALAVHCKQLTVLEVYFQRYSLPSELFTDEGLIALSEGCKGLQQLTLHNCDRISDRYGQQQHAHRSHSSAQHVRSTGFVFLQAVHVCFHTGSL